MKKVGAVAKEIACIGITNPRETTSLNAAYVAGLQTEIFPSLEEIDKKWQLEKKFRPSEDKPWRDKQYASWKPAVKKTKS